MISYHRREDGMVLVTFDRPDKPLNILSFASFQLLDRILDEIAGLDDPLPPGVAFVSAKPDNFIVGLDINEFLDFRSVSEAAQACLQGQRILAKIGLLPFPSVAAIHGPCLGGGLEIALNCTYRIVSDHPITCLGLPEVRLGLLPGLSGTQRLPLLLGPSAALEMLLTGKKVYAYQALKLGLVDEVVGPGVLLTAARQRLRNGDRVRPPSNRRRLATRVLDGPLRPLVFRQARRRSHARTLGNYPAPPEIIAVVRHGLRHRLPRGLAREAEGFGRLAMTPQHQALAHIFLAGKGGNRDFKARPQTVDQVGIVGAGFMGAGIATVCLDAGLTVRQNEVDLSALAPARAAIQNYFDGRVKRHIRTRRDAGLVLTHYSATTGYSGFGRSQAVVEAVFEDLDLKRQVVADLEERVAPDTLIATNTSSLPIAAIAEGAAHPQRIIGMHFFSPVEKMPLLEIIPSRYTDDQTLATAVGLGRSLGKTVIVAGDSPGFYVNRILTPYLGEAFRLLEDGVAVDELDRSARRMGFPVGPCTLLDEVGLDVAGKVSEVMRPFVGERLELTDHNHRFTEDRRLGRKNGRGFYTYSGGQRGKVDTAVYRLLDHPRRRELPYAQVRERLLAAILNECAYALDEGLIASPAEGDIGAIYGFGFPPFLGGPYWAMDRLGLPEVVRQMRELGQRHGSRFEPAPDLVTRAETGKGYYTPP